MKTKLLPALLALVLCMSVFFVPTAAFALEGEDESLTPDSFPATTENETVSDETVSEIPDSALTPDGTGTVLDRVTGEDNKQFYTITSADGSIFYLIIDGDRTENNVYFLNAVTLEDLAALAEKSGDESVSGILTQPSCTCTVKCESGKVNESCEVCKNDPGACAGKTAAEPQTDEPAGKSGGNIGMIVFIAIAVLAVAAVGVYVKIIRPKKQSKDEDDDDDYGEDFDPDAEFGHDGYLPEESEDLDGPDESADDTDLSDNQ